MARRGTRVTLGHRDLLQRSQAHDRAGWAAKRGHARCHAPSSDGQDFRVLEGPPRYSLDGPGRPTRTVSTASDRTAGSSTRASAQLLGLHAPYVRQWCETACALELLDYEPANGYRLAP